MYAAINIGVYTLRVYPPNGTKRKLARIEIYTPTGEKASSAAMNVNEMKAIKKFLEFGITKY